MNRMLWLGLAVWTMAACGDEPTAEEDCVGITMPATSTSFLSDPSRLAELEAAVPERYTAEAEYFDGSDPTTVTVEADVRFDAGVAFEPEDDILDPENPTCSPQISFPAQMLVRTSDGRLDERFAADIGFFVGFGDLADPSAPLPEALSTALLRDLDDVEGDYPERVDGFFVIGIVVSLTYRLGSNPFGEVQPVFDTGSAVIVAPAGDRSSLSW
ncbi:MAG: hypothetical protein ACFB9M_09015 [Myxococcota bacterium]